MDTCGVPAAGAARAVPSRRAGRGRREGAGRDRPGRDLPPGGARFRPLRPRRAADGAFDVGRAPRATLRAGELTVVLPKRSSAAAARTACPSPPPTRPRHEAALHRRHHRPARPRAAAQGAARRSSTHHGVDFVIANAENSAAGFGITKDIGDTLLEYGVDVMTSGNHIWDKKEAIDYIATERRAAPPRQLPRRRAGPRLVRGADGRRPAGRRHQRDGPRVHDRPSTIRSPSC